MFNLLPEDIKNSIKKEYKHKRLIVILFFAVCVQATFLIFIFPTWLSSLSKQKDVTEQSKELSASLGDLNVGSTVGVIRSLNTKLGVINDALEYPKLLQYINGIISKKTNSILIDSFSYTPVDSSSATLVLQGTSLTRDSLVSFVKSLEETKLFSKVDLPISNLAKDKDIEFTINLKIAKNES